MVKRLKRLLMDKYQWTVGVIDEEPFFETMELVAMDVEEENEPEEVFIDQLGWWWEFG